MVWVFECKRLIPEWEKLRLQIDTNELSSTYIYDTLMVLVDSNFLFPFRFIIHQLQW